MRSYRHNGVVIFKPTMNLIIVDVLEGLPIPIVSNPTNVIFPWNYSVESLLEVVFVFAKDYLQDDGPIIVIHLY